MIRAFTSGVKAGVYYAAMYTTLVVTLTVAWNAYDKFTKTLDEKEKKDKK